MFDILIQEGTAIDGTGSPGASADVAVSGDRIAAIGHLAGAEAAERIDASGMVVCPGFIDMHSHADFSLPLNRTADSLLHQGITTVVTGQCGLSPAPLLPSTRREVIAAMGGFFGEMINSMPWDRWTSLGDYLEYLTASGCSPNVVPLVGQGLIRAGVMGFREGNADTRQLNTMRELVADAMDQGAAGISTGLIYPPGSFTPTEELIELARVVGGRGGLYFSHIRGESDTLLDAVAEAVEIGRNSGAAVQISHFKAASEHNWEKSQQALDLIRRAREDGLDISSDLYPYLAGSTSLVTMLPQWAHVGGAEKIMEKLADHQIRARMASEMKTGGFAKGFESSQILITSAPGHPQFEGRRVSDLAREAGKDPYDWIFDALESTSLDIGMAVFGMSEENRRRELAFPAMMIGTDGFGLAADGALAKGVPHPRSYGAFPRVLGRYVRELGVLTLEEAVHRMTGLAAEKLKLKNRGRLATGSAADLVVFDPDAVADRADYECPHRYPEGIHHVIVNGRITVREGRHTGSLAGRILKRN